jgi:Pentapeptide repeats (8 copies)
MPGPSALVWASYAARFDGVTFRRANLLGADLQRARLFAAEFSDASLDGAWFVKSDCAWPGSAPRRSPVPSLTRWPDAETERLVREASVEVDAGHFKVEVLRLAAEEESEGWPATGWVHPVTGVPNLEVQDAC